MKSGFRKRCNYQGRKCELPWCEGLQRWTEAELVMGISFLDWRGGEGHLVSNILILEGSSQNGEKTKLCGKPYSLHLLLWQLRGKKKKKTTPLVHRNLTLQLCIQQVSCFQRQNIWGISDQLENVLHGQCLSSTALFCKIIASNWKERHASFDF